MHPSSGLFPSASRRWTLVLAAVALLSAGASPANAYDELFGSGFEHVVDAPASDAEAARFLGMATFGPTAAEIAHLRGVGYAEWIAQQLSMPTTLERPYVEQLDGIPQAAKPGQNNRLEAWLSSAITAPDQLRQRMAWAFSQIMVVTYAQSKLSGDPVAMAEYYDTLARDGAGWYDANGVYQAGTYTALLYDVTLTPAMGKMLTYRSNKVGDPALGTFPDENYAREVMQLFSIGLVLRNPDFSPIYPEGCDPTNSTACEPTPTYPQATVAAYAQVFTGWDYTSGFGSDPTRRHWSPADYTPMECYIGKHDSVHDKTLLSYSGNYADGSAKTLLADNGCGRDLAQGLSILSLHPNVAPFISRQLIQRFTTSNPSPAYIERVAQVFADNGSGVYGDLGAVIKAVLLDPEARYEAAHPPAPAVFGKAREPLLKLTALYRYYNAAAANGLYSFKPNDFMAYMQIPLGAPSVFNFYLPDYLPPGELGDAHLYGPEFQIVNESSAFSTANDLSDRAAAYLGNPANTAKTIAIDTTTLQSVAATPAALVAQLNHDLLAGAMSAHMQATLTAMVGQLPPDAAKRVTAALQVTLASPEFAIQK